ncbi:MAG: glycosyltransferase family 39 protein [Candidatus Sabulitectum sp.]|nr:glycosyltransferase family 39 protein [Candidatus Sabulitectum sp.]
MPRKDSFAVITVFLILWAVTAIPILRSPLGDYPVVDASWHDVWAGEIAGGDVFIYAPYFRAPLYPMVLGFVYLLSGGSPLSGILLSLLFSIFSVHIVHRIVYDRAGRIASLAAVSIWMFYGVNLFYSTTLLITPLYIFLLLFSFFLLDREKSDPMGWLVLGLAAITRPGAVLLFPLALILYRRAWKSSWMLLVPVVLVWAVNFAHGDGATVISSQGGINLYIGSGPEADGFTAFAPRGSGVPSDSLSCLDNVWAASYAPFEDEVLPSQVSSWWTHKTIDHITDHPASFLALTGRKLIYLISPVAIPGNYDVYYFGSYSPVLKILAGSPYLPVSGLLIWLIIPGAIFAGRLVEREKRLLLWVTCLAVGILPFFVTARFRLPVVPFMIILLVPRVLRNTGRSLLLAPVGVAIGLGLALISAGTVKSGGVNMALHDGVAHFQQGDVSAAEILLLRAVEVAFAREDGVDLNGVEALYNLGIISIRRRDMESAGMYWEMALARNPGYAPAREALMGLTR